MSRDIQLRQSTQMPTVPGDLFAGKGGGAAGPVGPGTGAQQQQPSPLQKAHRLLRGRYGLAVTLALVGAVAGALLGWFAQTPEQRSEGLIQIEPIIRSIATSDKTLPFYTQFMSSQPGVITSPRVLQQAVESSEWKSLNLPADGESLKTLRKGLEAANLKQTQLVRVAFTHERGDVAQTGVRAVINAYRTLVGDMNNKLLADDIQALEDKRVELTNAIRASQTSIFTLSEQYGTPEVMAPIHQGLVSETSGLQRELRVAKNNLRMAETLVGGGGAAAGGGDGAAGATTRPELTLEEIAAVDPTVREWMNQRTAQELSVKQLQLRGLGENHPSVRLGLDMMKLFDEQIAKAAELYRKSYSAPSMLVNGEKVLLTPAKMAELQDVVTRLEQLNTEAMVDAKRVGSVHQQIQQEQFKMETNKQELERIERRLEERQAEAASTGRIVVVNDGDLPMPANDKRKQMAFVGFLGGAALPVGIILLFGLMNSSYRYSEEATTDLSGVPLLGILPNLPDRLTDPEQAATAAHCVHQIRTMLQINGGDERQVYCVTSAGPGDGKTSLSLALGLSFAASGSRTLLIDCDLVGAGLTARLDMAGPEGILEAMANRTLLEYVRQTDIADLAMLPVGQAQAHHAGLFSPAALRRLVAEARKHFEVVLIDTGPILGSIEATPVCAASDAVILTVARGQQRPLVEKALGHLLAIGSRFAGVVFNRAQARDFESSISGMSLRSIARATGATTGNGANGANGRGGFRKGDAQPKAFGPVARAVAGSFKPTDGSENNG